MKRRLCILLVVLLLLILAIPAKLFWIGEPVDGDSLSVFLEEEEQMLTIHVSTPASAIAFRGWQLHQEGSSLYIRGRKVLVSSFFRSGSYSTMVDTTLLEEIYLGGRKIWTK